jgi:hypothetical protein
MEHADGEVFYLAPFTNTPSSTPYIVLEVVYKCTRPNYI